MWCLVWRSLGPRMELPVTLLSPSQTGSCRKGLALWWARLLRSQECCLYAGNNRDERAVWQWTTSRIPEALPGQRGPREPVGSLQSIPSLIFWRAITEPTYRNVLSSLDLHPGSAVQGLWWIIYPSDFNSSYISLCFLKWLLCFLVFIQTGDPKRGSCDYFV